MTKGYTLTDLGRKQGYLGLLKPSEIDDAIRSTFTLLQETDVPCTAEYISAYTRFSRWDVKNALRKLIQVDLVKELE